MLPWQLIINKLLIENLSLKIYPSISMCKVLKKNLYLSKNIINIIINVYFL